MNMLHLLRTIARDLASETPPEYDTPPVLVLDVEDKAIPVMLPGQTMDPRMKGWLAETAIPGWIREAGAKGYGLVLPCYVKKMPIAERDKIEDDLKRRGSLADIPGSIEGVSCVAIYKAHDKAAFAEYDRSGRVLALKEWQEWDGITDGTFLAGREALK